MLHNHASLRGALLVTSLLLTASAYAFQCPAESLEAKYGKADRVFLVLVTDTKLEPGIEIGIRDRALQYATPISAGYRVVEDLKGDPDYRPRLLDLLGIGTGYVGITPGMTYLILANNAGEDETRRFLWVNICNTILSYFRQEENGVKQALEKIRLLSCSDKAAVPPMPLR